MRLEFYTELDQYMTLGPIYVYICIVYYVCEL